MSERRGRGEGTGQKGTLVHAMIMMVNHKATI